MYGFNNYDPWPWIMMMNQRQQEKPKDEDIISSFKKYQEVYDEMKKRFEPPKKEEKKDDKDKWTTNDYWTFIVCFVMVSSITGAYLILHELIQLAEIIHR